MMKQQITRRSFFFGAAAASATPLVAKAMKAADLVDPNLSVFISDIHVSGKNLTSAWGVQPTYQNALFEKVIGQILEMRPRPARVVCFGDIALWFGRHEDYEASLPGFKRLEAAGIAVHLAMGNHDHRDAFLKYHPSYAKTSPVPGRIVSVVDLGTCDLLLLDSLQEASGGAGSHNPVDGAIDRAQWDWLAAESRRRTRPFICGAHHSPREMTQQVEGARKSVLAILRQAPLFLGWIHGHDHYWRKDFHIKDYGSTTLYRELVLPSSGWWGDIGYVTVRTEPDRAVLALVENDFFFPRLPKEGVARPALWNEILRENRGQTCTFMFNS